MCVEEKVEYVSDVRDKWACTARMMRQGESHLTGQYWCTVCRLYLTPSSTVLLDELTGSQLVKKFSACHGIRRCIAVLSRAPTCPCSEPDQSSPRTPSCFLEDPCLYYPPICAQVFQAVSFPQVFPPKPSMHGLSLSPVQHAPCSSSQLLMRLISSLLSLLCSLDAVLWFIRMFCSIIRH